VNHRCAAHPKENPRCRFRGPKSAMDSQTASLPVCVEHARHRLLNSRDPLLRFRGDRPVREPASIPNCSYIRASRPTAIAGPSLVSGRVFPRDPKESRSVLRSRVKELRPRAALTVDFLTSRRSGPPPALGNALLWFLRRLSWPCGEGRPGHREPPRSNCAQEGSGRTDEALRGRMARIFRSPFGVAGHRAERRTL
jgi:hypothetical protein